MLFEIVCQHGLQDLGFLGCSCTWTNRRYASDFICERLDRACANKSWMRLFPNTIVKHLSVSASDHKPLLIDTQANLSLSPRQFRFENMWSLNPSFHSNLDFLFLARQVR